MEGINYGYLLEKAENYALNFIQENKTANYCFHDATHMDDVVLATQEMAAYYKLPEQDRFALVFAAYFHELGYCVGGADGHEQRSVDLAMDFLQREGSPDELRDKVKGCILATRTPQSPKNLLEEIICDADLFHLGSDAFETQASKQYGVIHTSFSIYKLEARKVCAGLTHEDLRAKLPYTITSKVG